MNAIIVDDEKAAREATRLMLEAFCSNVTIVNEFSNVDAAAEFLKRQKVDVVFLDIEMPEKNGFELFNLVDCSALQVIFTTGHNEYAIKAFKYAACHYLLKPIIPNELISACQLAESRIKLGMNANNLQYLKQLLNNHSEYPESIVINIKSGYEILPVKSIIRFAGERNYTWVHSTSNKYLTSKTLKEYEEILDPRQFYRAHQSHLVNRSFLSKINNKGSANLELTDGTSIPISRHRKKEFILWLENK